MTTKIAHFADTHLGYRQYGLIEREEDFYDIFNEIIDDMISKNVDYVIHSGDLFENPKPPIKALLVAQKGFEKLLENNIPVYVIAGNHDIMQKRKTTIPQELFRNENFHILTLKENCTTMNDDIFIGGLPYISKNKEEVIKSQLIEILEKSRKYPWKILVLHGSIKKYFEIEPEFELDTVPEGFDYYAMGHLHKRIMDNFKGGKLSYPGSVEMRTKAEAYDYHEKSKGYNLITISDQLDVEYVNMELKRDFIVKSIDYSKLDEELDNLKNKINDLISNNYKKPIVDLTIKNGNFERSEVRERIYDILEDITLTIRISYESVEMINKLYPDLKEDDLRPEFLIREKIVKEFESDEIATLAVQLYKNLSVKNIEEAEVIAQEYYDKLYSEDNVEN